MTVHVLITSSVLQVKNAVNAIQITYKLLPAGKIPSN